MLSYAYCGHLLLVTDYMKKKRHLSDKCITRIKKRYDKCIWVVYKGYFLRIQFFKK